MVGWPLPTTLRLTSSKRNGRYFYLIGKYKDTHSFENSVMLMFGYIDDDRNKVHRMVKHILSPALGRPTEELENSLLFGSTDHCIEKIRAFYEAGAKRIIFGRLVII